MARNARTIVTIAGTIVATAALLTHLGGGPVATTEAAPTGNPLDQIIQQRGHHARRRGEGADVRVEGVARGGALT